MSSTNMLSQCDLPSYSFERVIISSRRDILVRFFFFFLRFSTQANMSSLKKDICMTSFLTCTSFSSFSCLHVLPRSSSTMLKRNSERGHPYLVPNLSIKASSLSTLSTMLAGWVFFIKLRKVSFIPSLLRVNYEQVQNIFSCFSISIDMIT